MAFWLLPLFLVVAAAHLVGEALRSLPLRYGTKPLLMPLLAAYYMAMASVLNPFLLLALACGWLGDLLLMIPDPHRTRKYFRLGLIAFLLGHVFYIAVFLPYLRNLPALPPGGWLLMLLYLATGLFGFHLIGPHAGAMRKAILAYVVVFVLLGMSVVLPLGAAAGRGVALALAGAFLFMVSDIVNAYNKFAREIPHERIYTMGTYLGGQLLLVQGILLF